MEPATVFDPAQENSRPQRRMQLKLLWSKGLLDQSDPSVRRQQMFTVVWMRTLAIAAQLVLLAVVGMLLHVTLPWPVLAFILGALALLNIVTVVRLRQGHRVGSFEVASQLFADLAAFSFVLYFTGGVTNPFVSLYLPLLGLAAAMLPWAQVVFLAVFSVVAYTLLMGNYLPLVLANPDDGVHFHLIGMWLNFLVSVLILVGFVARLSSSVRNRDQALGKAQQRLLGESRLAALGNQAASIAHQLGTPVSTISTIIADWRDEPALQAHGRELGTVLLQLDSIKSTLSQLRAQIEVDSQGAENTLPVLKAEWFHTALAGWRNRHPGQEVVVNLPGFPTHAVKLQRDLLELGLFTLLDNAAQSQQRAGCDAPLNVQLQVTQTTLRLVVKDQGEGIAPDLLPRLGRQVVKANGQGMGLFLLNSLLEREGGSLALQNVQGGVHAELVLPVVAA